MRRLASQSVTQFSLLSDESGLQFAGALALFLHILLLLGTVDCKFASSFGPAAAVLAVGSLSLQSVMLRGKLLRAWSISFCPLALAAPSLTSGIG